MKALPTLKQIQYFLALESTGSFSKAAEQSFVTQSTLSAAIQELENMMGTQLVDRSRRKIFINAAGQQMLPEFRNIILQAEHIASHAARLSNPDGGILRLGIIPTIAPFIFPGFLPALRQLLPHFEFQIEEDLTRHILDRINQRQIDVGIIAFPYPTHGLESLIITEEPFYFIGAKEQYGEIDSIDVNELEKMSLLLMEDGHCIRDHAMQSCRLSAANLHQSIKSNSLNTLVQLVSQGYGCSILPKMCIQSPMISEQSIHVAPITNRAATRGIGLVWYDGAIEERYLHTLQEALLS